MTDRDEEDRRLRDYGYGQQGEPTGPPTWVKMGPIEGIEPLCPNCGAWLCEVKVPMKSHLLRGGRGMGTYLGCPACAYASPMIMVSVGVGS